MTPEIGKEYPQPGEEQDIEAMIGTILRHLQKTYAPGKSLRQFHPKMHGFLAAEFRVVADLPVRMRHGFLQPGEVYDAWIRFSNANTRVSDDHKADLRGMAIKLLNVPGEMLVRDERMPQAQDILLVSYPTLMSPDVASFKKNIRAICGGFGSMLWFALNPMNWPALVRTLRSMKKTDTILGLQYWSVSPSRLGTADQAVKYSAVPRTRPTVAGQAASRSAMAGRASLGSDFLRDKMQEELTMRPFVFDFLVQFQEDAVAMPIENPCVEWKSPWHRVAEITIPMQVFTTAERRGAGEQASFSPWHSLPEHRPLGGISRARRKVYAAISAFRLQNNQNL
ncbi:MAG TPA: hypothetical protein VHW43_01115 [Puia sp.]|nr:hypothetical protein [Puia sp.]